MTFKFKVMGGGLCVRNLFQHWGERRDRWTALSLIVISHSLTEIHTFCDFMDSNMTITEGNSNWNFKQHHSVSQTDEQNSVIMFPWTSMGVSFHVLPLQACNSHEISSGVCLQGTETNTQQLRLANCDTSKHLVSASLFYLLLHVQQGLSVRLQHGVQARAESPQVTTIQPRLVRVMLLILDNVNMETITQRGQLRYS